MKLLFQLKTPTNTSRCTLSPFSMGYYHTTWTSTQSPSLTSIGFVFLVKKPITTRALKLTFWGTIFIVIVITNRTFSKYLFIKKLFRKEYFFKLSSSSLEKYLWRNYFLLSSLYSCKEGRIYYLKLHISGYK